MDILAELDTFERLVRERQHELAFRKLHFLLRSMSIHRQKKDAVFDSLDGEATAWVATRVAAATFQFFLDDEFALSEEGFCALSLYHRNFTVMLMVTPYRNADHVIRQLIGQDAGGGKPRASVDMATFRKVLFLWSVYSDVEIPLQNYMNTYPALIKYVVFNALTLDCYVDDKSTQRREQLLELISRDGMPLMLDDMSLMFAGPVWMYSAYPLTPRKHDIKGVINRAYRQWMLQQGISEPVLASPRARNKKPVVGVVIEQMTSTHAVFRCYGKALQGLRERFQTIAFAPTGHVDDAAMAIFDKVVYLDETVLDGMRNNVEKIVQHKPDMLIYLSLGMQNNTVPMATLRLAPIQMVLMAHPCTSRVPVIDYAVVTEGAAPTREDYSEQVLLVPNGTFSFTERGKLTHAQAPEKLSSQPGNGAIRIAIPSFAIKINARFMRVLERIRDTARRPVEFHFFPYLVGISFRHFRHAVEQRLPGSVVHLPYQYERYLQAVGRCDFHMSPFPFGNTNGNIDSARMGLPLIVMAGEGIESRIDVNMLRRMGMPEWTIAADEDAYVALAVSLVDDDEKRLALERRVKAVDLDSVFYTTGKEEKFCQLVADVLEHHEIIRASGIRMLKASDLAALVTHGDAHATAFAGR